MAQIESKECDYCGQSNESNYEQCTKCGKYHNEDPEEYSKYKDHIQNFKSQIKNGLHNKLQFKK